MLGRIHGPTASLLNRKRGLVFLAGADILGAVAAGLLLPPEEQKSLSLFFFWDLDRLLSVGAAALAFEWIHSHVSPYVQAHRSEKGHGCLSSLESSEFSIVLGKRPCPGFSPFAGP